MHRLGAATLTLCLLAPLVPGQTLWSLDPGNPLGPVGPPYLNDYHMNSTVSPVPCHHTPPPFLSGPVDPHPPTEPPHFLASFPAAPLRPILSRAAGGNDVDLSPCLPLTPTVGFAPLYATDGSQICRYTLGGDPVACCGIPSTIPGGPLTGLAVQSGRGNTPPTLWVTTATHIAHLTPPPDCRVIRVCPAPPPLEGVTGIAWDPYLSGPIGPAVWVTDVRGHIVLVGDVGPAACVPRAVLDPGCVRLIPPPYTGISFDTTVPPPGRLWVVNQASASLPALAQPIDLPAPGCARCPIPAQMHNDGPVGVGFSPQPRFYGRPCPCAPGPVSVSHIGWDGGFPVIGNRCFKVTVDTIGGSPLFAALFFSPWPSEAGHRICDCLVYLTPPYFLGLGIPGPPGTFQFPLPVPDSTTIIGAAIYFQWAVHCPTNPCGFVFSDAMAVTIAGV